MSDSLNNERNDGQEDDEKLRRLVRWMKGYGFENLHDLRIQQTPIGRGAVASKNIDEETLLLVNKKLFLTDDSQEIGPHGDVGRFIRKYVTEDLEVLALFLFYERFLKNERSFWFPWIGIMFFSSLVCSSQQLR